MLVSLLMIISLDGYFVRHTVEETLDKAGAVGGSLSGHRQAAAGVLEAG
jgi:hypothetical protein